MNINIKVIPHKQQRYPTCGDYWLDKKGVYQVRISKMSDWRYEFLITFHELFELAWVIFKKVPLRRIDEFDIEFEKRRVKGNTDEPGDDPEAPYYEGHQWATVLEKIAAGFLGVSWARYDKEVTKL